MFVKGDPRINREGRPVGLKDKKWASLDYWFKLAEDVWEELSAKDQAHIAVDAWKALLARKQFPLTPQESVQNADSAMKLLKLMQEVSRNGSNNGITTGSSEISLDNGRLETQTSKASTSSL